MKNIFLSIILFLCFSLNANAIDLTKATIVVGKNEAPLLKKVATMLAEDIERVSGVKPAVAQKKGEGSNVIISVSKEGLPGWESYSISTSGDDIMVKGYDARGAAYGALHISEKIGVNPWYWFADIPVKHQQTIDYAENFISNSPSIKYRGIFINDEDWGLKTWAERNYEKELGDIGPKTYARVCELLLRLKGNMLAPAMHSCTGAFYSHPESQRVAAEYGIMITTSHCEPLLFNNAAESEWQKERDGEWNYLTNKETIYKKLFNRIRETAQYDNIYTMGMRGLHDEAMKGSTDNSVRARTLEKVFEDQRGILNKFKVSKKGYNAVDKVPQIFVPYKETLDIYDAGLRVPEDITIVWPDDNYGYMKRVSNAKERERQGGSGVYYHLSYLGTPHDNLWISTTAPVLMYEELMKAYNAGADRYWLLNVGDIKPMEIETQTFFDLAWDVNTYDIKSVNKAQAKWMAGIFGKHYEKHFQQIFDTYYRLAWQRKPEFMGYEIEWDNAQNDQLHDTDFSFQTGAAQERLLDYQQIASMVDNIEKSLSADYRPAFFEMMGYAVKSAYQMNLKFLMAQLNHETGSKEAADKCIAANDSLQALVHEYNSLLGGKWNQMMSEIPPGFVAKYPQMPELHSSPTDKHKLPAWQKHPEYAHKADLNEVKGIEPIVGMGTDWLVLPVENGKPINIKVDASLMKDKQKLNVCVSVLPMWPLYDNVSNRFAVSIDGGKPTVFENKFIEWSQEWKLQVLENRKEFTLSAPVESDRKEHVITITAVDPGQFVQAVSFE